MSTEELREIMTKKGKMRFSNDDDINDNDENDDQVIIQDNDGDIMTMVMTRAMMTTIK